MHVHVYVQTGNSQSEIIHLNYGRKFQSSAPRAHVTHNNGSLIAYNYLIIRARIISTVN